MNNENLENIKIAERVKNIMRENQYFGGNENNKKTFIRVRRLFDKFNIR